MKTAGIICEYNPFHEGHRYHIEETRRRTGADGIICVMSGNFVQRGEPAVIRKQKRVQAALEGGADIVVELPFIYACSGAETFATGGVRLLEATGITDVLSFGAEFDDIEKLNSIAQELTHESPDFKSVLRSGLDAGRSFAVSRQEALTAALCGTTGGRQCPEEMVGQIIKSPNCILGIEYIKAMKKYRVGFEAAAIRRIGSGHDGRHDGGHAADASYTGSFPCASDIRASMTSEEKDINGADSFSLPVVAMLRKMSPEAAAGYPDMEPGLANRIIRYAGKYSRLSDIVSAVSTKRYTAARVRRILMYILTDLTNEKRTRMYADGVPYIRVLGFNTVGREMLADMRKNASVPIFTRGKDIQKYCFQRGNQTFDFECRASDQYALAGNGAEDTKQCGSELKYVPVRL